MFIIYLMDIILIYQLLFDSLAFVWGIQSRRWLVRMVLAELSFRGSQTRSLLHILEFLQTKFLCTGKLTYYQYVLLDEQIESFHCFIGLILHSCEAFPAILSILSLEFFFEFDSNLYRMAECYKNMMIDLIVCEEKNLPN